MRRTIRATIAVMLMGTAAVAPAVALDTARPDVREFIDGVVKRNKLDPAWVQRMVAAAETQQTIIELMQRPAERVRPWHLYRDHFMRAERIDAGVAFWVENRDRLAEIAGTTGVAPHVIVGILGVETFFGRITGRFRVLDALATLGFDYPARGEYFRGELEQFLLLARQNDIDPLTVKGSYAGAMGLPQFMPRSYLNYAVDGDLDGRSDLWGSRDDVLSSVANYLKKHGWEPAAPIVVPAVLVDVDAEGLVAGSLTTNRNVGELRRAGLNFDASLSDDRPALLVGVRGRDGPEYLVGLKNLAVIMRYNRSPMYALAVHELGSCIEAALPPVPAPLPPAVPAEPAGVPGSAGATPDAAAPMSRPASPTAADGAPL